MPSRAGVSVSKMEFKKVTVQVTGAIKNPR